MKRMKKETIDANHKQVCEKVILATKERLLALDSGIIKLQIDLNGLMEKRDSELKFIISIHEKGIEALK